MRKIFKRFFYIVVLPLHLRNLYSKSNFGSIDSCLLANNDLFNVSTNTATTLGLITFRKVGNAISPQRATVKIQTTFIKDRESNKIKLPSIKHTDS
jgi:hypothetical protein